MSKRTKLYNIEVQRKFGYYVRVFLFFKEHCLHQVRLMVKMTACRLRVNVHVYRHNKKLSSSNRLEKRHLS